MRWYLSALAALLLLLPAHSLKAAANEESDLTEPRTLFSNDRFHYFQDSLVVEFQLEKRPDITNFTGTLLGIRSNNDINTAIFIDWDRQGAQTNLYLTYGEHINRFTITDSLLFEGPHKTPVRIMLDFRGDLAKFEIGSNSVLMYGMQLSAQRGYKLDLLPLLAHSPNPNVSPVLTISSLRAQYAGRDFLGST